jgi:hypothetical protein
MTSKPRLTSLSDMSSAELLMGRWRMIALIGFSDFGKEEK